MTEFGYEPEDETPGVVGKTGLGDGTGAVEALPRVTLRMTRRQLDLIKTQCEFAGNMGEATDSEYEAIAEALELLGAEPPPETVYDISYAPEVHPKW